MPVVFPNITEDKGILVQSIYLENNSQAFIVDSDTIYEEVPDTEINITIEQNSRILAIFSGEATLSIGTTFNFGVNFFVTLDIEGVGNRTMRIHFYDNGGPTATTREITHNLCNVYQSEPLPAGTYTVSVYWKSEYDATGSAQLILSTIANPKTRALLVQELI